MTVPIEVDLPHKLGRDEAKRRIGGGFGRLAEFVPGGAITEHRWEGDVLEFVVEGGANRRKLGKAWLGEAGLYITIGTDDFELTSDRDIDESLDLVAIAVRRE